jgi:hypothetical protein
MDPGQNLLSNMRPKRPVQQDSSANSALQRLWGKEGWSLQKLLLHCNKVLVRLSNVKKREAAKFCLWPLRPINVLCYAYVMLAFSMVEQKSTTAC